MSHESDKSIDLSGLPCPMPVVKVSKAIKEIEVGQVLEAKTTDPGALTDFPAWAKTSGHQIMEVVKTDDGATFYIKRVE